MEVRFFKTGIEIKQAIETRQAELQIRLEKRTKTLDHFMQDPLKLRSYLIRHTQRRFHDRSFLAGKNDISSEELEEIDQLCRRIREIEQEIRRLSMITSHLDDSRTFELGYSDLLAYGFTPTS
jgi:hypothetical protein